MSNIFSAAHLDLFDTGNLYLTSMPDAELFDAMECGHIAAPYWPPDLGHEPEWFDGEVWKCLGWWRDEMEMLDGEFEASLAADRREVYRLTYP